MTKSKLPKTHIGEDKALEQAREQGLEPVDTFVVSTDDGEQEFATREEALEAVDGDESKIGQRRAMVPVQKNEEKKGEA